MKVGKLYYLFLSALFLITAQNPCVGNTEPVAVAVNDFRGESVDESSARIISERIRAELVNNTLFRVIERAEMNTILTEQGFQQSGACDDQSCLVEVGQLLGVDRMIAGSVGKLGNMYTLSMRVIDVGSAQIVATVTEDCKCSIEDLVSVSAPSLVRKLAARLDTSGSTTLKAQMVGILRLSSAPQGARVSIDGKVMGVTPYENTTLNLGDHALRLELDGYQVREERIQVSSAHKSLDLSYTLEPVEPTRKVAPRRRRIVRRIAFGTGAVVCALAGYRLDRQAKTAYDDYSSIPARAPADEFDKEWQDVKTFTRLRNGAYIFSGVLAAGFTLSIVF